MSDIDSFLGSSASEAGESEFAGYDMERAHAESSQKGPCRNFVFTQYNVDDNPIEMYLKAKMPLQYVVYQHEIGKKNGTHHLQGYVQLKNNNWTWQRIAALNPLEDGVKGKGSRIAWAYGSSEANDLYCTKSDTRCPGTSVVKWGTPKFAVGRRAEMSQRESTDQMLLDAYRGVFDPHASEEHTLFAIRHDAQLKVARSLCHVPLKSFDTKVIFHFGVSRSGKTWNALLGIYDYAFNKSKNKNTATLIGHADLTPAHDNGCEESGVKKHISPMSYEVTSFSEGKPWFDGYTGQQRLVINEVGPGRLDFRNLLLLTDRAGGMFPVKHGSVMRNWNEVHITSNYHPREWFPKERDVSPLMNRVWCVIHYPNMHPSQAHLQNRSWDDMTEDDEGVFAA